MADSSQTHAFGRPDRITQVVEPIRGCLFAEQWIAVEADLDFELVREHRFAADEARLARTAVCPDLDDRSARYEAEADMPSRAPSQLAHVARETAWSLRTLRRAGFHGKVPLQGTAPAASPDGCLLIVAADWRDCSSCLRRFIRWPSAARSRSVRRISRNISPSSSFT